MNVTTTRLGPRARSSIDQTLRVMARGAVTIACICAFAVVVLAFRYLAFEYNHGDRQILFRLLDSLMP